MKVDPTGAKETAFANANIPITADITVAKALSLESNVASGGSPVLVPPDERITVVGTAAELESLTRSQLKALGAIIDTTATGGTDSGKTAVHKIAGSDAPPVFTAGDMTALGNAHIAVVAPPNDPTQNDGTTVITGRGMTFDITWDSSVASAPAAFQTDVEEVFQLYADTYTGPAGSPTTLYYHVGFGEVDNEVMSSSDLGESDYNNSVGENYAHRVVAAHRRRDIAGAIGGAGDIAGDRSDQQQSYRLLGRGGSDPGLRQCAGKLQRRS